MINVCFAVKYTSKIRAVYKNRWSISYINLIFGKMLGNMRNHFVPIRRLLESSSLVQCQGGMIIVLGIERNLCGIDLLSIRNHRRQ